MADVVAASLGEEALLTIDRRLLIIRNTFTTPIWTGGNNLF